MRKFRTSLELFCDLKIDKYVKYLTHVSSEYVIAKLHAIFSEVWLVELLELCNPYS